VAQSYFDSRRKIGFPLASDSIRAEVLATAEAAEAKAANKIEDTINNKADGKGKKTKNARQAQQEKGKA
jgi:glycyl-tRNA synthetase alpha chain